MPVVIVLFPWPTTREQLNATEEFVNVLTSGDSFRSPVFKLWQQRVSEISVAMKTKITTGDDPHHEQTQQQVDSERHSLQQC